MAAVTRSRAIKARRLLSSRVMVCVTVLDMQRQLTDLRPEVLSWLATVPVAERPADAVEVVGSRADDRHMGIPPTEQRLTGYHLRPLNWPVHRAPGRPRGRSPRVQRPGSGRTQPRGNAQVDRLSPRRR